MKTSTMMRNFLWALLLTLSTGAGADDTDIFGYPPSVAPPAPNILFILDNTANWSKASQHWVGSSTQGDAELLAIKNFVAGLTKPANVGLMMLTTTGQDGGYVRFHIRPMLSGSPGSYTVTASNTALQNLVAGINTNSPNEKINQSSGDYANALYETWLYIRGAASWAGMDGAADYSGNAYTYSAFQKGASSPYAYVSSATRALYNSPVGSGCGKTYIIFIGNNRQGQLPPTPAASDPASTTLTTYSYTSLPDVQSAWARFLKQRPDLNTGGSAGAIAAANGSITTYAIDAYNAQQNTAFSTMMQDMATNGGGDYFQAGSDVALQTALGTILSKIQAVNSTFAGASLPVSVAQRGVNLNQVYLGMFRPDTNSYPNWVGNLKQYQYKKIGSTVVLVDANGNPTANSTSGFISPSATSFWTQASSFWNSSTYPDSQGVGGTSDSPDGDLVEKGGAGQYLRTTFATSSSARKVYTCTGSTAGSNCAAGTVLSTSSYKFDTSNTAITQAALGSGAAPEPANIINWVRGEDNTLDDNPDISSATKLTNIRGFAHGDVVHSKPAIVNYNVNNCATVNSVTTCDDVVIFYGANDGMLHAVRGGQTTANGDGNELWTFIASEHFSQLKRMRDHSPIISSANKKPYFIDGSATTYTYSSSTDGKINYSRAGDKAYLFLSMRRGGRFIYALDVTNPNAPKFLWKHSSTDAGFSQLGQTWSDLTVAKIRYTTNPVLVFGLGYDAAANDVVSVGTATMGQGVMVLDAVTGNIIWQAGKNIATASTLPFGLSVPTMTYAIPAAMTVADTNGDGYADRIYAADTGANIWRINIDDASPANWTVNKLASLGGSGANARKFLNNPDLVLANTQTTYDTILIGSGDREQPFDTTITNRFYMIRDNHSLNYVPGSALTESSLFDATSDCLQTCTGGSLTTAQSALQTASGWYITLGTGEKVDGLPTTLYGTVYFGTNTPQSTSGNLCSANLGDARIYAVNYLDAGASFDQNQNGIFNGGDRSILLAGGGFPPPPNAFMVPPPGGGTGLLSGVCFGPNCTNLNAPPVERRYRNYWYKTSD